MSSFSGNVNTVAYPLAPISSAWNDRAGDWQNLDDTRHLPRYEIVTCFVDRLVRAQPSILDVGCGEGLLARHLSPCQYTGVEPSRMAVHAARSKGLRVVHATAEAFNPGPRTWDAIIFNEMLYYCADPISVLRKYARLVAPHGVIIVSIFQRMAPFFPIHEVIRKRLARLVNPQIPRANWDCTRMVLRFIGQTGWSTMRRVVLGVDARRYLILALDPHAAARERPEAARGVAPGWRP